VIFGDRELHRLYRQYNARWFGGELPEDVDCFFAPVEDCHGLVWQESGGWILQINPKYLVDANLWKITLLHEMAHLKVLPYWRHGAPFQAEMQRLAIAGAFRRLW
jgi:hypothetical protein